MTDEDEALKLRETEAEEKLKELKAELDKLPETFTDISYQLSQVSQAFQIVTEGSNIGAEDFAEYIENINTKMKLLGETVLSLGHWERKW